MTWRGFWEGIASVFEDFLFIPLDWLRELELSSWWAANFMSWIFLIITFLAFFYWMGQLKKFNDSSESTYTFDENPNNL